VDYAVRATINRDTAMLDLLLQYGWDINTPTGWDAPPALS